MDDRRNEDADYVLSGTFTVADPGSDRASALDEQQVRARAREQLFGSQEASPRVGRFAILEKLGEGGMGAVFAAYDAKLDRRIAVKILRGAGNSSSGHERLRREALSLGKLNHPNIVGIYDVGEWDGATFLAMELVDGESLDAWLRARARTETEILDVFDQAAGGLIAAHNAGIVHRDFKPENVMVDKDGRVRVLDFGIARMEDSAASFDGPRGEATDEDLDMGEASVAKTWASQDSLTRTGSLVGTPAYMAPEQVRGRPSDARTDQFAFCICLFQAFLGRRPFTGDSFAKLAGSIVTDRPMSTITKKIPTEVREVLRRGLEKDPVDRFPSMEALLSTLRLGKRRKRRRRRVQVVVATLGLLAMIAGGRQVYERRVLAKCASDAAVIRVDWNDARAAQVREAMKTNGRPYAEQVAGKTFPWIDGWVNAWEDTSATACRQRELDGLLVGADAMKSSECLRDGRVQLEVLLTALEDPPDELLRNATQIASRLPDPDACIDRDKLGLRVVPPKAYEEELVQARREFAAIFEATMMGTSERAKERLTELRSTAESLGDEVLAARIDIELGALAGADAKHSEAREYLTRAFELAGRHDARAVMADAALALALQVGSKEENAEVGRVWEHVARGLIASIERAPGTRALRLAEIGGQISFYDGDYERAEREFDAAIVLGRSLKGPEHPGLIPVSNNRAMSIHRHGRHQDALVAVQEVVRRYEDEYGPEHPKVASTLANLAAIYSAHGDYEAGVRASQRAVEVWSEALGPEHYRVHKARTTLAETLYGAGRIEQAIEVGKTAIEGMKRASDGAHPAIGIGWINLATAQRAANRMEDAAHSYEEGIASLRASLRSTHPNIGIVLNNYGNFLADQGQLDRAEDFYGQSLKVYEEGVGADHPLASYPWSGISDISTSRGDYGRAVKAARKSLDILEARSQSPIKLAKARFRLAKARWNAAPRDRDERAAALALGVAACEQLGTVESPEELIEECRQWLEQRRN